MSKRVLAFALSVLAAVIPRPGEAQVRPDLAWRSVATEHFRVHFTADLEALARRTAWNAESAYTLLSAELAPPRGPIDIVVADNVDFANGYATPFPSNRIVIYARPPVEEMALRNHEDWNRILVTHELTHIFHLDRARGWWGAAQRLFGRAPLFFPNSYAPSWILEGLAVHYETRVGGGGRLAGTEFPMFVRAAALDGSLPSLDALSLGAPRFPGGNSAYVYGAYAITRADSARMGRFVEASSRRLLPWRHDANARAAFGISFTARWAAWRDSVTRVEAGNAPVADDAATLTTLTTHGFIARFPRFVSDDALVYVASDARVTTGLYRVGIDGARRRLGRRNSVDVNVPLGGYRTLQSELEYADPYTLRSELTTALRGRRRQVTNEGRLSHPDAHVASGRIVAVQTAPGTTSLVMMDTTDAWIPHVLAEGSLDLYWAEPRLSHDAARVAAVRWQHGGRMDVVVLDLAGTVLRAFAPRGPHLTVVSSPVWEPGDTTLLFVSDHEGRPMVYRGDVRSGAYARIWESATGLNTPDVSPDGHRLAAVELRADGYHVVTREMPAAVALASPLADPRLEAGASAPPAASLDTSVRATRLAPLRQLSPTWWLPVVSTTDPGTLSLGAMTEGRDVVGRHAYVAQASLESSRRELTTYGSYAYAGFGNPVLYLDAAMDWQHGVIRDNTGSFVGYLGQRSRRGSLDVVVRRPRVRVGSYALFGGEFEATDYRTYPPNLLSRLSNPIFRSVQRTEALRVAAGISTMQRPMLALSAEDGVSASVSHRLRYGVGVQFEDVAETIVSGTLAKSLSLPGFARHVIAAHGVYGITGHAATSAFAVGGVSGSALELAPGVTIGGSPRTFGVRGFDGGAQLGVRAAALSAEYRAPLALVGRGVKLLPVFFQKASLTAFTDAAAAWCGRAVPSSFICTAPLPSRTWIASAGAELAFDASLQYDQIYRFRVGVAHPVRGLAFARQANTLYFSLGSAW